MDTVNCISGLVVVVWGFISLGFLQINVFIRKETCTILKDLFWFDMY